MEKKKSVQELKVIVNFINCLIEWYDKIFVKEHFPIKLLYQAIFVCFLHSDVDINLN